MKRIISLALAVGLVFAFSMTASAVDVKFSGQWQFEGWYESNRNLGDTNPNKAPATGFVDSSLRLTTQFKVAEGLTLTTRARILDKIWGDKGGTDLRDASGGTAMDTQNRPHFGDRLQRENIEFDQLYMDARLGPGLLRVGTASGQFGTLFSDTDSPGNGISYAFRGIKGVTLVASWARAAENEVKMQNYTGSTNPNSAATTPFFSNASDTNNDRYGLTFIYSQPTWDAGITYGYSISHATSISGTNVYGAPYTFNWSVFDGYGRGTFGPVFAEIEGLWAFGDYVDNRVGNSGNRGFLTTPSSGFGAAFIPAYSISQNAKALFAHVRYAAGPAYLGAKFAYVSGDDPNTTDKNEAGYLSSGREFKPCLILLNSDRDKYLGALGPGYSLASTMPNLVGVTSTNNYLNAYGTGGSSNFFLYQGYVGFKPIAKLDLSASYTYVALDQKQRIGGPTGAQYLDDKVGNEFDISATYKLYDNLSYMVGFGYLWAGDAWKGADATRTIGNDWLLMHRLTLNF